MDSLSPNLVFVMLLGGIFLFRVIVGIINRYGIYSNNDIGLGKLKSVALSNNISLYSEVIEVNIKYHESNGNFYPCLLYIENNKFRTKVGTFEIQGTVEKYSPTHEYYPQKRVYLLFLGGNTFATENLKLIEAIQKYYGTYLQLKRVNEEAATQLKNENEKVAIKLKNVATQLKIENNRAELIKRRMDNQERLKAIAQEQMNIETEEITRKRLREQEVLALENRLNIVKRSSAITTENEKDENAKMLKRIMDANEKYYEDIQNNK